jgi:hypothetical protein
MSARAANSHRARMFLWAALSFAVFVAACSRQVGDACTTNVECSPLGDRFCDLSSPSGYCTVEGCDSTSCPDNSSCVSFFALQRGSASCTYGLVPRSDCRGQDCCEPGSIDCCRLGERCLCDTADCKRGYCASETSEHRWCMRTCSSDGDCRDGYRCYATNQYGAIAVATRNDGGVIELPVVKYCAPARAE